MTGEPPRTTPPRDYPAYEPPGKTGPAHPSADLFVAQDDRRPPEGSPATRMTAVAG